MMQFANSVTHLDWNRSDLTKIFYIARFPAIADCVKWFSFMGRAQALKWSFCYCGICRDNSYNEWSLVFVYLLSRTLFFKAKMQHLLTCKVSRCCLLALPGTTSWLSSDRIILNAIPAANTRRRTNDDSMLGQRRRRWVNIEPALVQRLLLAGMKSRRPEQVKHAVYFIKDRPLQPGILDFIDQYRRRIQGGTFKKVPIYIVRLELEGAKLPLYKVAV